MMPEYVLAEGIAVLTTKNYPASERDERLRVLIFELWK